jgi:hypothetical protein
VNAEALTLWHASDDPHIEIFHPHRAPTANIDDVPAYWFPRDCPRATFWAGPKTTPEDAASLNGGTRVHAIEKEWWDRFHVARVHLYLMPPATFTKHAPEAGYYVSCESVTPLARIDIDDLVAEHATAGIALQVLDNLWPLWHRVIASSLEFSGIRLRNARPRPLDSPHDRRDYDVAREEGLQVQKTNWRECKVVRTPQIVRTM